MIPTESVGSCDLSMTEEQTGQQLPISRVRHIFNPCRQENGRFSIEKMKYAIFVPFFVNVEFMRWGSQFRIICELLSFSSSLRFCASLKMECSQVGSKRILPAKLNDIGPE